MFSLRSGFIQFRGIRHTIDLLRGKYDNPDEPGQITHFQALMAALSGTIGLGNIAGVAIAISLGGPGTILWMWIAGLFGMATKFYECTLGTKYRVIKDGNVYGGPMYYIKERLPKFLKPLAFLYAFSTIFGAFGAGGMFQANQAASALSAYFNIPALLTGLILAAAIAVVIIGGIKRIGQVAGKIVPAMCIIYIIGALIICAMNISQLPDIFGLIISDAFSGNAVAGGAVGTVIIWGIRRAVFSNEAGLGSASIAHAAVKTKYPIREGFVASIGPFIDTVIVCTATAIVIILSGQYATSAYAKNTSTIDFESQKNHNTNAYWIRTNNPSDNQGYRIKHQASDKISTYTSAPLNIVTEKTTWYGTKYNALLGDGIQFKTKRDRGNYALIIRDKNDEKVTALRLSGDEKFFFASNLTFGTMSLVYFSLNQTKSDGTWQTHTVSFKEQTNEWIKLNPAMHNMYLEFIVDKNTTDFEIDDIMIGKPKSGIQLTIAAFDQYLKGFGSIFITIAVVLFAFSTMITWSYYGESALMFLFGKKAILPFKVVFIGLIILGSIISLETVINFSDLMIGLMVIPNTIAILYLINDVSKDLFSYTKKLRNNELKVYKK